MVIGRKRFAIPSEQTLKDQKTLSQTRKLHFVLKTPQGELPPDHEVLMVGMGCFWGAEKKFWELKGVYTTMVGYAGGHTQNPTYEEVCSGKTGHIEVVRVVFDPGKVSFDTLLQTFWRGHDPTQGMRQGVDIGTQYRSAVFYSNEGQYQSIEKTRKAFLEKEKINRGKRARLTTEIIPVEPFYFAEEYHQQYLAKQPGASCSV